MLHSSRLKSDLDFYRDKDVVIIGCGATCVQLVPSIANVTRHLTVLRRTMPYVSLKKKQPLSSTMLEYHLHRWWYEIRNDVITFFDYHRGAEFFLRSWTWWSEYIWPDFLQHGVASLTSWAKFLQGGAPPSSSTSSLPSGAWPAPGQPLQCTRRAFDYLGFRASLRRPNVEIIDIRSDPIHGYSEGGIVLQSGRHLSADLVVLATGYHVGRSNLYFTVNGTKVVTSPPFTEDVLRLPNVFSPGAGCSLFCIIPRVVEDNMHYFVREFRKHRNSTDPILFFDPEMVSSTLPTDEFLERNHILGSPNRNSQRYLYEKKNEFKEVKHWQRMQTFGGTRMFSNAVQFLLSSVKLT